jgi:hypothetical protein
MDTVGIENLPIDRGGADCQTRPKPVHPVFWQTLSMSAFRNGGQGAQDDSGVVRDGSALPISV